LEHYRKHNLIFDGDKDGSLQFEVGWDHKAIDNWLRGLFPDVFEWLDRFGVSEKDGYHWKLVGKDYQRLFLYERDHLSGEDLQGLFTTSRSFRERTLRFGKHAPLLIVIGADNVPSSDYTDYSAQSLLRLEEGTISSKKYCRQTRKSIQTRCD
jgi:hypothetical protein